MTDRLSQSATSASLDALPEVVLELRQGIGRTATFPISHVDFLIGTVPGCDLRVSGSELPAVLCLLARRPGGLALRKLAPTQIILVNGKTATHVDLNDGDRISVGATDIFVRLKAKPAATPEQSTNAEAQPDNSSDEERPRFEEEVARFQHERDVFLEDQKQRRAELHKIETLLQEREAKLQAQIAEFDRDRAFWMQRRQNQQPPELPDTDLPQRQERLTLRETELQDQLADIQRQRQEFANVRRELTDIRKQLYDRYQERRDRLAGLQEAVEKAARKVQERKRLVDSEEQDLQQRSRRLEQQATQLEEETRQFQEQSDQLRQVLVDKQADLQAREHRLAADQLELEGMVKHYQADILRLQRQNEDLQERERKLKQRDEELERRQAQWQQGQTKLKEDEARLAQRDADLQSRAEQQDVRESSMETQQATVSALRARLERQREELQSQEQVLEEQRASQEQAAVDLEKEQQECAALREQLRLRRTELDTLDELIRDRAERFQADDTALKRRQEEWNLSYQNVLEELNIRKQQMEAKEKVLDEQSRQQEKRDVDLVKNERSQRQQMQQVQESAQRLAQEREKFSAEQQQARQKQEQTQALFVEMRLQAESFVEQLPELELRVGATLERLAHSREQLRDHLGEITTYVRQCQEDMERDQRKIQEKEQVLRQHQDEHRLALVSFRRQVLDWQTKVAEYKRSAQGEGQSDRADAQAAPPPPPVESVGQAPPSGLQDLRRKPIPEPKVEPERRAEPKRHPDLSQVADVFKTSVVAPSLPAPRDPVAAAAPPVAAQAEPEPEICSWYRQRFRRLTGSMGERQLNAALPLTDGPQDKTSGAGDDGDAPLIPIRRDILSLTDPADPGDRQLAESLRRLKLIDPDMLQALLVETRRQRRPLRQVLLADGALTLYQLAHIEAGDINGLTVGPLFVIDRLRANAQEMIYQAFDPRRNQDAVLRHLTQEQLAIAGRADEFRKRFQQALLTHPHLAKTLEVLDLSGRPAVLQECVTGLSCADWPPLVSVPGVCFRILLQITQALEAAHTAGLVHGHLNENMIVLTPEGIAKICGLGEPAWLIEEQPAAQASPSIAGDLLSLGQVVLKWCTPVGIRRGAKTKPPPDALLALVTRLAGADNPGYNTTAEVLQDLEKIRQDIPANPEAWDRLLRHVREHAAPLPLRNAA